MKGKEKLADLGTRILANCRNELYCYFPYMDGAFASLEYEAVMEQELFVPANEGIDCTGDQSTLADIIIPVTWTDGEKLYYSPQSLVKRYMKSPSEVKRGYLHILLHCLYFHLFPINVNMNWRIWNLACDMTVELLIEKETKKNSILIWDNGQDLSKISEKVTKTEENISHPYVVVRKACIEMLLNISASKILSAEQIYQLLTNNYFPYSLELLEAAFIFDSHVHWKQIAKGEKGTLLRKKWERIASFTAQNKQNGQNRRGSQSGDDQETLELLKPGRYDYRRFLKKFAIPREEVELDTESFDYIFYNYGLEHYGNLPLIEPLEYKEVNRLEELVIAIDTSGSCSKEMVQKFLDETYRIFSEKENFFRKMKVHILQCDCHLMDTAVIHSDEEWKEYSKNVVIQGRSGTNFRPVFRYVEEQRAKKEIKNLKALIYFTDGDGVFPEKTDYETAFVFVKKCECMDLIPSWITKLLIY